MYEVEEFKLSNELPWGMLDGMVSHSSQLEEILWYMLMECVKAKKFIPVQLSRSYPSLENIGMIRKTGDQTSYTLTEEALCRLHKYYGIPKVPTLEHLKGVNL